MSDKRNVAKALVCLALALGTALLYAPVLHFDFVNYDDPLYVINNFHIRSIGWQSLRWCFQTGYASLWHPLTWMSHMLDYQLFGLQPGRYHATNVALHIANSILLFAVLQRMTKALWRSAMVAALFAWHPMHVESVAWISERKDVLSALCWMLTLWAYIRYAQMPSAPSSAESAAASEGPQPGPGRRNFYYALALLFFALGLMAKPMLVTLPFVLLLLDWWPLGRFHPKNSSAPGAGESATSTAFLPLLLEKIPFLALSLVTSVLTLKSASHVIRPLAQVPLTHRLAIALLAYLRYVEKLVWPQGMVAVYPNQPHLLPQDVILAGLFVLVVSVVAIRLCHTRPFWLVGWFSYLGILLPVIGLVQVGTQPMGDHNTYLPSIGIFVILCWEACDIALAWPNGRGLLAAVSVAVLAGCLAVSSKQIQYWRNPVTLFTHNLEVTPDNYVARADFAAYLRDTLQLEQARQQCELAIAQAPNYAWSHHVLGGVYYLQGKFTEADEELRNALRLDPSRVDVHFALASVALARNNPEEAASQYRTLLAADPANPQAHCGLGQAFAMENKLDEAAAQYTEASRLAPKYPEAHYQFGLLFAMQRNTTEAIKQYRVVLALQPDRADTLNNLAWLLATDPRPENRDGVEALELASRACTLTHNQQPGPLGTLAAACAEVGDFDRAVAAAQKAHDLALAQGNQALAARELGLLELYRSHHAFHEK